MKTELSQSKIKNPSLLEQAKAQEQLAYLRAQLTEIDKFYAGIQTETRDLTIDPIAKAAAMLENEKQHRSQRRKLTKLIGKMEQLYPQS